MTGVRERLGQELFQRVAGPDGAVHAERIHNRPGPRWFDSDSPICQVHGDAAMFVGGGIRRCSSRPCIRRRCAASPSTPATGVTCGGGWLAPADTSP